jgi:hypothetical protein
MMPAGSGDRDGPEMCTRHLVVSGRGIRTIQGVLGHTDVRRIMVYLHPTNRSELGVGSPLDTMG